MSKKCTPWWREADFQVRMLKIIPGSEHFLTLRCRKSARRCGAKHISKSKCYKHHMFGPIFESWDVVLRGRRKGLCTLSKVSKTWGFCSISTTTATTLHSTPLQLQAQLLLQLQYFASLHYTRLHYTTLHYNYNCNYSYSYSYSLNYKHTTLHYTNYTTVHYTTLH